MKEETNIVCVTGASGFIGSHLQKELSTDLDIEFIPFEGDLLNKADIEAFFDRNQGIVQIVHLVGGFSGNFADLVNLNTIAFGNLLEVAQDKLKIQKIIYTSTGAVYGEPIGTESFEDDPLQPSTVYGLSKLFGERTLQYFSETNGWQAVILRFPNIYGDCGGKGVIDLFLKGINEQHKITVYGDGTASRNFLHISDACRAIHLAINSNKSGIYNISNPTKFSVNDIVTKLKEKYQFEVEKKPVNNNHKNLLLNIDKAKKDLGFRPEVKDFLAQT